MRHDISQHQVRPSEEAGPLIGLKQWNERWHLFWWLSSATLMRGSVAAQWPFGQLTFGTLSLPPCSLHHKHTGRQSTAQWKEQVWDSDLTLEQRGILTSVLILQGQCLQSQFLWKLHSILRPQSALWCTLADSPSWEMLGVWGPHFLNREWERVVGGLWASNRNRTSDRRAGP